MATSDLSVLFLGRENDPHGERALAFCRQQFGSVHVETGRWGDPKPEVFRSWNGDLIVSYLSRWIVPRGTLERASVAALNFHPATPDYPGIGCVNFALYEEAREYGAMCHHMQPQVDTGQVVAVSRFPVYQADTVASLLDRTYDHMLTLFYAVMDSIIEERPLPTTNECWTRKPFRRSELDELAMLKRSMSEAEIQRRVRATRFGPWEPSFVDETS